MVKSEEIKMVINIKREREKEGSILHLHKSCQEKEV